MGKSGRRGNNEGSIRQRADGLWEARVSVDGRQRSVYAKTRAEAARKMRSAQRQAEHGLPITGGHESLGSFLERWLRDSIKPRLSPRTYSSYAMHVHRHLVPGLGRTPLRSLQPAQVQVFMNAKLEEGLSVASVQRIRSTLRAALNQAVKWGDVSRNVASLIDLPAERRPKVEPLTPQQARDFLRHVAGHRWQPLFVVALATGLRQGELLALRWEDVDLERGELKVRHSLQRIDGHRQLVKPKTARSVRGIVLPSTAVDALRRQQALQSEAKEAQRGRWGEAGFVFTTLIGTPLDGAEVTRVFQALLQEAGLPRRRFHDLRHSCATFLLAQGVNHRDVMEILGHSGIAVTMNTYAHVLPETQRDAARRMDGVLRGEASI